MPADGLRVPFFQHHFGGQLAWQPDAYLR